MCDGLSPKKPRRGWTVGQERQALSGKSWAVREGAAPPQDNKTIEIDEIWRSGQRTGKPNGGDASRMHSLGKSREERSAGNTSDWVWGLAVMRVVLCSGQCCFVGSYVLQGCFVVPLEARILSWSFGRFEGGRCVEVGEQHECKAPNQSTTMTVRQSRWSHCALSMQRATMNVVLYSVQVTGAVGRASPIVVDEFPLISLLWSLLAVCINSAVQCNAAAGQHAERSFGGAERPQNFQRFLQQDAPKRANCLVHVFQELPQSAGSFGRCCGGETDEPIFAASDGALGRCFGWRWTGQV